jgi:NADPH:quinone reductase-like Zn-dependent oxidoreductase
VEAKCIKYYKFGSPQDVLRVENTNILPPKNGEVLVRMRMRPINPSDLIPIRGAYSHRISLPTIPGYEGIGIVEEVGPSVSHDLIGKRVLPLRGEGTWQEFVKVSAKWVVPIPSFMDENIAAQLYINPLTAWIICTEVLRLKPDDVLLVNACGSAIGRIFAQLSTILGFQMIAVTRNNTYTEELLRLGATYVINTSDILLHHTVMEVTNGRGVTAAIDSIGGSDGTELATCVGSKGIIITLGLLSGVPVDWKRVLHKADVSVKMFHLRHWNEQVSVQHWHETFNRLIGLISQERLKLMNPDSHYDLSEVQEAVRVAENSKRNKGKIFLKG